MGYEGGDSSYDYGAAISEDRHVWREKYSEEKLEANFLKVTPAYLTASPGNASNGFYTNTDAITTTPVFGTDHPTNFYIVRQANWTSLAHMQYTITLPISGAGNVTLPQLGGQLSLNGRDSKIHLTDYDIGGVDLVYCTADIMTWARSETGKRVLVMYGGANEVHEYAFAAEHGRPVVVQGSGVKIVQKGSNWVVQWTVLPATQIVRFPGCNLAVRMLWRNQAYDYWVLELPAPAPVNMYASPSKSHVIVNGGYLLRTAEIEGRELRLTGDVNATTHFELVYAPTDRINSISMNGLPLKASDTQNGNLGAIVTFTPPILSLPDFATAVWKAIDCLPEITSAYSDTLWTPCDHTNSTNDQLGLLTPTSLYASDYGYHTGSLLYRGHFSSNGGETTLYLNVSGGSGFGYSVWINQTYLGAWTGSVNNATYEQTFTLSQKLDSGCQYVITVLIDHMGQNEEAPGTDAIKFPYGILNYDLGGHSQGEVDWKMTGNLGGENYADHARGPRNEGAMFAERMGYHLPAPPSAEWAAASPMQGLQEPGVMFYSTHFTLDVPKGYDVPLSVRFNRGAYGNGSDYRVQFFVNGYQFGKYSKHATSLIFSLFSLATYVTRYHADEMI